MSRSTSPNSTKRSHKCPYSPCIYTSSHRANLQRHMAAMHSSNSNVKECCERQFHSRLHYHKHLRQEHSNGFKCQLCERYFVRKSILSRHMDAVHSSPPHSHQCPKCPYSTSHKSNLKRHMTVKHVEDKMGAPGKGQIWRPVPELFSPTCTMHNELHSSTTVAVRREPAFVNQLQESPIYFHKKLRTHLRLSS